MDRCFPGLIDVPIPATLLPDLPWRSRLCNWPDPWREMWGRRANDLADAGRKFPEDERIAFEQVLAVKVGRSAELPPIEGPTGAGTKTGATT